MDPIATKLTAAKDYLGDQWVGHPNYQYRPRHSNNPDIYVQARQPYLRKVTAAARCEQQKNPAFLRAERIRNTFPTL